MAEGKNIVRSLLENKGIDSGHIILLHVAGSPTCRPHQERNNYVVGHLWGNARINPVNGMGNMYAGRTDLHPDELGVDISDGTYLGAEILGYEVIERSAHADFTVERRPNRAGVI